MTERIQPPMRYAPPQYKLTRAYLWLAFLVAFAAGGFTAQQVSAAVAPPPNDQFSSPQLIEGLPVSTPATCKQVRHDPEEAEAGFGGETMWYIWTAPSSGYVEIAVNTRRLDVVTGDVIDSLDPIRLERLKIDRTPRQHSDWEYVYRSMVSAGTTYRLAINCESAGVHKLAIEPAVDHPFARGRGNTDRFKLTFPIRVGARERADVEMSGYFLVDPVGSGGTKRYPLKRDRTTLRAGKPTTISMHLKRKRDCLKVFNALKGQHIKTDRAFGLATFTSVAGATTTVPWEANPQNLTKADVSKIRHGKKGSC